MMGKRTESNEEDVSNEETGEEVVGTQNESRLALLDRINDNNDAENSNEFFELDDSGNVVEFKPRSSDGEEVEEKTENVDDSSEEEDETEQVVPPKIKLKVNGQEQELTMEEVIARAQKVESADAYLAEAARIRRETEESAKKNLKPGLSEEDVQASLLEQRRALARAIQMGTEEEAIEAIAKLQETSRAPSFNKDDLARTVDERLSFQEAVTDFRTNFPEIANDPVLSKIAADRDMELLQAGDNRSYSKRYTEIGKDLRSWLKTLKGDNKPLEEEESKQREKQARKASVKGVPDSAGIKNQKPVDDDEKDESPSEVIAKMAQARGGPQWARG